MEGGERHFFFKNGDKTVVNNYWPISKLSVFEKIFESLFFPQLAYLVKYRINNEQYGFVEERSVESN